MQLQYLCSFDVDDSIRVCLGRLPPRLEELYSELYDVVSKKSGEYERLIFRNVLIWLLCARRTLHSREFLFAVSTIPNKPAISVSKDLVLKLCNNFVIFDAQLDTFRFAHLSVREFLDSRQEYKETVANAIAAEICLIHSLSLSPDLATKKFVSTQLQSANTRSEWPSIFNEYSDTYWAVHCQLAHDERMSGNLGNVFRFSMSGKAGGDCPIGLWTVRIAAFLKLSPDIPYELQSQLEDCVAYAKYTFGFRFVHLLRL